jgi:predicted outer membrane repeat protein
MIMMCNCNFISNKANQHGGAMYLDDSIMKLNSSGNPKFPIEFRNNEAVVGVRN